MSSPRPVQASGTAGPWAPAPNLRPFTLIPSVANLSLQFITLHSVTKQIYKGLVNLQFWKIFYSGLIKPYRHKTYP